MTRTNPTPEQPVALPVPVLAALMLLVVVCPVLVVVCPVLVVVCPVLVLVWGGKDWIPPHVPAGRSPRSELK